MKKQYLICCALLLSASYAQHTCTMQGQQHNALANQAVQPAHVALEANPIAEQAQPAHHIEFAPEGRRMISQIARDLTAALPQSAQQQLQPVSQAQPAQHIEFAPEGRRMINQIARDLSATLPQLAQQQVQPAQEAQRAQAVASMQAIGQAQSSRPVQAEQREQLTDRQLQILQALIQDLDGLNRDDIQVMLIDAYSNPLALANSTFMEVLTTQEQRRLAQEFIAITLDPQAARQPARLVQPELPLLEQGLIAQLAQGLASLERDDIDAVLIEAYTNPYVLAQSPALLQVLNNEQKALVDDLLEVYTQRISQQN